MTETVHWPAITPSKGGDWAVFCAACSGDAHRYVYPCQAGMWGSTTGTPPPLVRADTLQAENDQLREQRNWYEGRTNIRRDERDALRERTEAAEAALARVTVLIWAREQLIARKGYNDGCMSHLAVADVRAALAAAVPTPEEES